MGPIFKLRAAKHDAVARALADLDLAQLRASAEKRGLNPEELARDNKHNAVIAQLDAEIAAEEAKLAGERAQAGTGEPAGGRLHDDPVPQRSTGKVNGRWRDLFGAPRPATAQGWKDSGEFARVIASGLSHPALMAASMVEGVGSDGGHVVPVEFASRAFDAAVEAEPLLQKVRLEPMLSSEKVVAGFTSDNHSATGPFGLAGAWLAEGASLDAEKALVRALRLRAKRVGILSQASAELVADGQDFESQLMSSMTRGMSWMFSEAILNGSGAGQPAGIINAAATVEVPKLTNQSGDTLKYGNLTDMLSRLLPSAISGACWFASHTCRPQLMELSIPVGTGGTHYPLLMGPDGTYKLLGLDLYFTEHCAPIGDRGDIVLGNFGLGYVFGVREQITLAKSSHVGFAASLETYRAIARVDGQCTFDKAFTPKNGSTVGPFCVLQAR